MNERFLVILIVILTVIIMSIFLYKTFKNKNYCFKCKNKKNKKM